jgi:hypothetical protein
MNNAAVGTQVPDVLGAYVSYSTSIGGVWNVALRTLLLQISITTGRV